MSAKSTVSVVKVEGEDIEEALNKSVDLLGGVREIRGKKLVAIKPNLCSLKSPYSGATTDPRIVEAIIKKIRAISPCEINIVESNTAHATADESFETLGYVDLEKKYSKVKCVNLSRDSKVRLSLNGKIFSTIRVPETMFFSEYLISVAKLKTHVDYRYSGVLKNGYGFLLLSPRERTHYHGFMKQALADINRIYKPDLSVIDGIVGMEGFGPLEGTPKKIGVIIASKDPVAADTVGAQIMGINPTSIKYLKYAENQGIGSMKEIEVLGSDLQELITKIDFIPLKWYYLGRFSLWLQRLHIYFSNLARFVSLVRSSLSTVGFSALNERLSYKAMIRLAKDTILRIDA